MRNCCCANFTKIRILTNNKPLVNHSHYLWNITPTINKYFLTQFTKYLRLDFSTILSVDDILPLAAEYEVQSVLQKCEDVLLTELEFKIAKVSPHHVNEDSNVKYLMKCLYYGEKYSLQELYRRSFETTQPYKLRRYIQNEH